MEPEDSPIDDEIIMEEWRRWNVQARSQEPIFVEAIDHHEIDLGYPGIEIIKNTEPSHA